MSGCYNCKSVTELCWEDINAVAEYLAGQKSWRSIPEKEPCITGIVKNAGTLEQIDLPHKTALSRFSIESDFPDDETRDKKIAEIFQLMKITAKSVLHINIQCSFTTEEDNLRNNDIRNMIAFWYGYGKPCLHIRLNQKEQLYFKAHGIRQLINSFIDIVEMPININLKGGFHKIELCDTDDVAGCLAITELIEVIGAKVIPSKIDNMLEMMKKILSCFPMAKEKTYTWSLQTYYHYHNEEYVSADWMESERLEDAAVQIWDKLIERKVPVTDNVAIAFHSLFENLEAFRDLTLMGAPESLYEVKLGSWECEVIDDDDEEDVITKAYLILICKFGRLQLHIEGNYDNESGESIRKHLELLGISFDEWRWY